MILQATYWTNGLYRNIYNDFYIWFDLFFTSKYKFLFFLTCTTSSVVDDHPIEDAEYLDFDMVIAGELESEEQPSEVADYLDSKVYVKSACTIFYFERF